MKKLIKPKKLFLLSLSVLLSLLIISGSCNKATFNPNTGIIGDTTNSGSPGPSEVFIQYMAFNPSPIYVTINTTVTWINLDMVDHTITSDTRLFDSGIIGTNGTFNYTFTIAGTFSYHCKVHPDMLAKVVVNTPVTINPPGY